jgi:hypothetical protein
MTAAEERSFPPVSDSLVEEPTRIRPRKQRRHRLSSEAADRPPTIKAVFAS